MLKIATEENIRYYEKKLYPLQDEICTLIQNDNFYLSGGTCLSRFYYQHRYSDDLYYLMNEFSFEQTVLWAEEKMTLLDYEGLSIVFADKELEGEVLLTKNISREKFSAFKEKLIGQMFDYAENSR